MLRLTQDRTLILSLLLPPVLLFLPFLLGLKTLGGPDFLQTYLPWQEWLSQAVAGGNLPSWNPYAMLGRPTWGEIENSLLYPPRWILFFAPAYSASLYVLFHLFLMHWGGFRLGKTLGASTNAAWIAGFLMTYSAWSGHHMYANHMFILSTVAWVPWLLQALLAEDFDSWSFKKVAHFFFLGALLLSAGSPQMAVFSFYFLLIALLLLRPGVFLRPRFWGVQLLAGACILLYASPHLISSAILKAESTRSGSYPAEAAVLFALNPKDMLQMFFLGFYLPSAEAQTYETGFFINPLLLILFCLGLVFTKNHRRLVLLGGLFLFLGMAWPTPAYQVVRKLPFLDSFRVPGRWLIFAILTLSLFIGLTFDRLNGRWSSPKRWPPLLFSLLLVVPSWMYFFRLLPERDTSVIQSYETVVEKVREASKTPTPRLSVNTHRFPPNWFWKDGIEVTNGRAPLLPKRLVYFYSGPTPNAFWIENYPTLAPKPFTPTSLLAAPLTISEEAIEHRAIEEIASVDGLKILEDRSSFPPVRFYPQAQTVSSMEDSMKLLYAGTNPFENLWIENDTPVVNQMGRGECNLLEKHPEHIQAKCFSETGGFMWLSQLHYPGWKAFVNEEKAEIFPAHLLFQAIKIPKGESEVRVVYRPWYLPYTKVISFLIGVFMFVGWLRLKRNPQGQSRRSQDTVSNSSNS